MQLEYLEEVKKLLLGKSYSIVGKDVRRLDAIEKVTGLAKYTADQMVEGALIVRAVRCPYPHAVVKRIDKRKALKVPGVEGVITAEDIPGRNQIGYLAEDQPLLTTKARYVGDIVALVAARSDEAAFQGSEELKIEYERLPALFDPKESISSEIKLHEHGNIAGDVKVRKGDVEQAFKGCDLIVERTYRSGSQDHAYLEPEAALAIPQGYKGVTVIGTIQTPHRIRRILARVLGWQEADITVITPYVGGAFGGKASYGPVICGIVGLAAVVLGKPVMILYSRYESFAYRFKRGSFEIKFKSGVTRDGKLRGIQVNFMIDAGGYAVSALGFMPRAAYHATGVYEADNVKVDGIAVYTNNLPSGAFNGFGDPQMQFAVESQMDLLAEQLNMDPVEFRLRNALVPGARTGTNQLLDHSVGVKDLIEKVAKKADWREKRGQFANHKAKNTRKGIGVGCSWHACGTTGIRQDWAGASLILNSDGSVAYSTGIVELGQGTTTSHAMMVAEVLGIPFDWVRVGANNTDTTPDSGATSAQRGTIFGGTAAVDAALKLRKRIERLAAELLECKDEDISIENGEVYDINNGDQKISFREIAYEMYMRGLSPGEYGFIKARREYPDPETGQGDAYAAYTFACTVAEVEVDLETGHVQVVKLYPGVAAGKIIQPAVVRGQVVGCSLLGLGYALTERVLSCDGQILNRSYSDYLVPTIKDKPEIADLVCVEDEYRYSGFGAKGVGEIALIATPPAIVNAIHNAIGIRFYEIPLNVEKIYFAIKERASNGSRNEAITEV